MVSSYTTPQNVQSELRANNPFTTTTYPSLQDVQRWILDASAYIDSMSGSVAGELARTETIDYSGAEFINLKYSPIISVSSLLYNTNPLGSDLGEAFVTKTEGTDYFVYKEEGQILINFLKFTPTIGPRRLKVVYTSGYEEPPQLYQMLATKIVADRVISSLLNSNVNDGNDGGSISFGSNSIVEPSGMGVQNYQRLKNEIKELSEQLLKGTGVYRYTAG